MNIYPRVLTVTALALTAMSSIATASAGRADSGTAWLSATHNQGGLLIVAGDISDKVLGNGAIVYRIKASSSAPGTVKATSKSVTLFTKDGSLKGTGSATETINSDGTSDITGGKISLLKGSGKQKGHSLVGTFSGSFKDNVYTFHYKGTYK